ncbi:universal stress protein [Roseiconus lacunae]|uniref:universal stress protein n=1 Tax=Roseiconus lacunae TaxID=2605694 RepID=UPI001E580E99|nr:universal stress protein [Roseiconus lacunae]MCD0463330.1 universal stress protein [Roseiconus lacunae]
MKVLLATDCSNQAYEAAKALLSLPISEPIEVTIITALAEPYVSVPEASQQWYPQLLQQERVRSEQHQDELAKLLGERFIIAEKVTRPGHPVRVILSEAESIHCDLIVMGAQGHSFLGRLLIGSVSDSVATHATCSVLIVRSPGEAGDASRSDAVSHAKRSPITDVTVGYDGSAPAREAVNEMAGLGWDEATKFELLSVAPIYDYLLGTGLTTAAIENEELVFREMQQRCEEMVDNISDSLPNATSCVVHDQRVGPAIVEQAEKTNADLIVVGDAGHSLIDDLLLGSTTKYVLRHAGCSVWISRQHRQ